MSYTWQPNKHTANVLGYVSDDLLMDESGDVIARLEDFGYAAYPCAINISTGQLERGGAYADRVAAMQWAERVAGLHPLKKGDKRPAFYYGKDRI